MNYFACCDGQKSLLLWGFQICRAKKNFCKVHFAASFMRLIYSGLETLFMFSFNIVNYQPKLLVLIQF